MCWCEVAMHLTCAEVDDNDTLWCFHCIKDSQLIVWKLLTNNRASLDTNDCDESASTAKTPAVYAEAVSAYISKIPAVSAKDDSACISKPPSEDAKHDNACISKPPVVNAQDESACITKPPTVQPSIPLPERKRPRAPRSNKRTSNCMDIL
jgi:hypothetical protein